MTEQLNLFESTTPHRVQRTDKPLMSQDALIKWKSKIFDCQLILYIGETQNTPKARWNGTHDAKDYVSNYIELHRKYKLDVRVCSAFWYDTPADRKARLKLESELIHRFYSPFNKESWHRWGQPFGKI